MTDLTNLVGRRVRSSRYGHGGVIVTWHYRAGDKIECNVRTPEGEWFTELLDRMVLVPAGEISSPVDDLSDAEIAAAIVLAAEHGEPVTASAARRVAMAFLVAKGFTAADLAPDETQPSDTGV